MVQRSFDVGPRWHEQAIVCEGISNFTLKRLKTSAARRKPSENIDLAGVHRIFQEQQQTYHMMDTSI
jgi:hypothetical protein